MSSAILVDSCILGLCTRQILALSMPLKADSDFDVVCRYSMSTIGGWPNEMAALCLL